MECTKCDGQGIIDDGAEDSPKLCPACGGTGDVPTLADVIALLERQAETCERIAKTLTAIEHTVRALK